MSLPNTAACFRSSQGMAIVSSSHAFCSQPPLPKMPVPLLFEGVKQGHQLCDAFPHLSFPPQPIKSPLYQIRYTLHIIIS